MTLTRKANAEYCKTYREKNKEEYRTSDAIVRDKLG